MELIVKERTESTNEDLKRCLSPAEWTTVLAFEQTGGRGSRGREFLSPVGGAYFSVVFSPSPDILPLVTPLAAIAVRRAVAELYGADTKIKWVNDLYLCDKKVCGILTETRTFGDKISAVVGIGVNLYAPKNGFGKYSDVAASVSSAEPDREKIIAFVKAVVENIGSLLSTDFMPEYIKNSYFRAGQSVLYVESEQEIPAVFEGINRDGTVTLSFSDGKKTVNSGRILPLTESSDS